MNSNHKQKFEFLDRALAEHIKHEKEASAPHRPCPDENIFGAFLENTLTDKEKIELETHLAACTACQTQMANVLKILAAEQAQISPARKPVSRRWLGIIPYGLFGELRFAHAFAALIIVSVLIYGGNRLMRVTHTEQQADLPAPEKKSEPEALKQAPVSEEKKEASNLLYERALEAQTPPVPEGRSHARAASKGKSAQKTAQSYAEFSITTEKEVEPEATRSEAAKIEADTASPAFGLQAGAPAPKPAPPPPAPLERRKDERYINVPGQAPAGPAADSRAEAPVSANIELRDKVERADTKAAQKKPFGRSKMASGEGALNTGLAGGQGPTITYIDSPLKEEGTNLEMQIAQRLNALGIPRDHKELVPQVRSTKLSLQQDPSSRKRAIVDASGVTKEFYFVGGIWVDKEILQSQSPAAIWIKFDSPEYKKLFTDQETAQDAATESEESKKRLEDQRNLKKYFALGERVLIVQKNQIYYLMK